MTIYALSSGPGISGIAVIRVSGPHTKKVLKNMTFLGIPNAKTATLRKFKSSKTNELIDEGVLLWFPGPESYTGEDMAEFHVHGSRAVIDAMHLSISNIDGAKNRGQEKKIDLEENKQNPAEKNIEEPDVSFEEKDAFLLEAGNIVLDLISLQKTIGREKVSPTSTSR